jgi:hypothetical protein
MKLWVLPVLFLLSLALPCAARDTGVVRVSVKTEATQTPIAGVELSLEPRFGMDCAYCNLPSTEAELLEYLERLAALRLTPDPKISTESNNVEKLIAATDGSGNAILRGVKYGFYVLVARRSGYYAPLDLSLGDPRSTKASSIVQLNRSHDEVEVVIYLTPAATIRGTVVNMDGVPLSNVSIAPGLLSEGPVRHAFFFADAALTDERGEFLVELPSHGSYLLRAARQSPATVIYYPGDPTLETAGRLSLRAGDEFTRITIVFPENQ